MLLRAVLHALRDHPAVDACAHLAAQLPTLVRGFYYEGWHPADKPLKYRDQAEFKRLVAAEAPRIPEEALDDGIEAVLKVLSAGRDSEGQKFAAEAVAELWPYARL